MPYVNAEVPFKLLGNKQVLTDHQIMNEPWLWEFVCRFQHCFEYNVANSCYVYYPKDGD